MRKSIGLASDHAGKDLKIQIIDYLHSQGYDIIDHGIEISCDKSVDYPDFVSKLAKDISNKKLEKGIAICGSGIGMSIVANKYNGIRAANVSDIYSAKMSKMHNDCNVLCLGSRVLNYFRAIDIVEMWLKTSFEGNRHLGRLNKIIEIEKANFK